MSAEETIPLREIRRRLRGLPRERRKDVLAAIRAGREVTDPRDAELAVAWAERLDAKRSRWPRWLMPRARPVGWRAWVWLLHLIWIAAAVAYAYAAVWPVLPPLWRWVGLGVLVYGALSTPVTMRQVLRAYWNAPEAVHKNRKLLDRG